ncbi:MAG: hypothetical protein ACI9OD_001378 [Limisphaerales bacterium]|jgi:hypothetical protein
MTRPVTHRSPIWLMLLAISAGVLDVAACRFNVRDVGFVDLGSQPYRLFCYVDAKTDAAEVTLLRDVSLAVYLDCNIQAEVISLKYLNNGAAKAQFDLVKGRPLPAAVLVDGTGRGLAVNIGAGAGFQEKIWDSLEAVSESAGRSALLEQVVNRYGVLLLVEGKDAARNQAVRAIADSAIELVAKAINEKSLEKEIENPPSVMVVKAEDRQQERILLWSLGISETSVNEPQLAILYGRARQIGSVLSGDKITKSAVSAILNTIGLSCECGLDRSWMQGHMIPSKWEESTQSLAAKTLGFDPESPAIKMEMSQILSKSGQSRKAKEFGNGAALLAGYSEIAANVTTDQTDQSASPDKIALTNSVAPPVATPLPLPPTVTVSAPVTIHSRGRFLWVVVTGVGIFVGLIGAFIFFRTAGKH